MGKIKLPVQAKLFIGIIAQNNDLLYRVKNEIEKEWGTIDLESEIFPFDATNYYKDEMGENLIKKFYGFKKLVERENIVEIKLKTNDMEERIKRERGNPKREVNIDPGYLTLSNITLATTKDYRHRIYLGKGIYLENTLYYNRREKSYVEWEWTYPDYRKNEYKAFFNKMREIYRNQLKYGEDFGEKI